MVYGLIFLTLFRFRPQNGLRPHIGQRIVSHPEVGARDEVHRDRRGQPPQIRQSKKRILKIKNSFKRYFKF